jgi:sporulation protein YlmC with PRC-barrel domain
MTRITGTTDASSPGPGPTIMAADTLQGDRVLNEEGDELGKIVHIMLDVPRGRIAYAVLSRGGVMGIGDKLLAIPWNALRLDTDRHCFVLDVDSHLLDEVPGFDKDHWPAMADPDWAARLHDHFGKPAYWA